MREMPEGISNRQRCADEAGRLPLTGRSVNFKALGKGNFRLQDAPQLRLEARTRSAGTLKLDP